ncbi:ABC transporter substrate-binding protein [Limosilactobacillus fermentum]
MKFKWKRFAGLVLAGTLLTGVVAPVTGITAPTTVSAAAKTKTVTDITGTKVKVPTKVTRVADLWHASNQVVLLLGGQKKLVATTPIIKQEGWFKTVDPGISKVTAPFSGQDIQIESLVKTKPDVVISSNPEQVKQAKQANLTAVNAMFQDFAGMKKSITLTADILGGDAPKIAKKYIKYLDGNISYVKKQLKGVKTTPSVLHITSPADLTKVDGTKTIVDEWIKMAGGKNAITTAGNMITVNAEDIVKANPNVIIVGQTTTANARKLLKADSTLSQLKAVKDNKVYGNPQGTFPWDRYSAEEALQILWAAQKLHPDQFKNLDMVKKTKSFYKTYYNYDLTTKQAKQILAGEMPK